MYVFHVMMLASIMCLLCFLRIVVSNICCVVLFDLFVFVLCLVCPVFLNCPFMIAPLVSSNVYSTRFPTKTDAFI